MPHTQHSLHRGLGSRSLPPPIINTLHCLLGQCCSQRPRPKHWLGSGFGPWAPHGRCTLLLGDELNGNKLHSDCMWQTISYIWVYAHQIRWKSLGHEREAETRSLFIILPGDRASHPGVRDQRRWNISDFQKMSWMFYGCCPCSVSGADRIWLETCLVFSSLTEDKVTKSTIKLSEISHKRAESARGGQAVVSVGVCCDVFFLILLILLLFYIYIILFADVKTLAYM